MLRGVRKRGTVIPQNTFPIGEDEFGNKILISMELADRGKIYFWNREHQTPEGSIPDYSNLFLLASNFDDFISELFVLYVNDIVQLFDGLCVCKLYADDLKLYSIVQSTTDTQTMQDALDKLLKWQTHGS